MIPTLDAIKEAHSQGLVYVRPHWLDESVVICNYTPRCTYSNAWDDTTIGCRGLTLRLDSPWERATRIEEVLALPFGKFFNYGEEGRYPKAPLVSVSEKIDGSLGILYRLNGEHFIATRGAFGSPQAAWATEHLRKTHKNLAAIPDGMTLLFEIVYPDGKIIIDYGATERLVLLAARNRYDGSELSDDDLRIAGRSWGFYWYPSTHAGTDIEYLLESAKRTGYGVSQEGWVCRFADGSRFKIKERTYIEVAKALKGLSPKRVFEAMAAGGIDALEVNTPEEVLPEIQSWRRAIQSRHDSIVLEVWNLYALAPVESAKEFSLWVNGNYPDYAALLFAIYRGYDLEAATWKWMDRRGDYGISE